MTSTVEMGKTPQNYEFQHVFSPAVNQTGLFTEIQELLQVALPPLKLPPSRAVSMATT